MEVLAEQSSVTLPKEPTCEGAAMSCERKMPLPSACAVAGISKITGCDFAGSSAALTLDEFKIEIAHASSNAAKRKSSATREPQRGQADTPEFRG